MRVCLFQSGVRAFFCLTPCSLSPLQGGTDVPLYLQVNRLESKEHFLSVVPPNMSVTVVCIEQVRGVGGFVSAPLHTGQHVYRPTHEVFGLWIQLSVHRDVPHCLVKRMTRWAYGLLNEPPSPHPPHPTPPHPTPPHPTPPHPTPPPPHFFSPSTPPHPLPISQLKMNLMAMSCTCPAAIPLISNLIVSDDTSPDPEDPPWTQAYVCSLYMHPYPALLFSVRSWRVAVN